MNFHLKEVSPPISIFIFSPQNFQSFGVKKVSLFQILFPKSLVYPLKGLWPKGIIYPILRYIKNDWKLLFLNFKDKIIFQKM